MFIYVHIYLFHSGATEIGSPRGLPPGDRTSVEYPPVHYGDILKRCHAVVVSVEKVRPQAALASSNWSAGCRASNSPT